MRGSSSSNNARWTKRDADDIARIGIMISGFLESKIYTRDTNFRDIFVKPLIKGSLFALERFQYLMSSLMVKHA